MSQSRPPRMALKFGLSLLISAGAIAWLVATIEWQRVWQIMGSMALLPLLPLFGLFALHFVLRAVRWRWLLPAGMECRLRYLWDAIMVGNFASFILPLRAGEFIRPLYLTRFCSVRFATAFASVVTERFFDLSMVLLAFGFFVSRLDGTPAWVHQGAESLLALAAAILGGMIALVVAPQFCDRCIAVATSWLPARWAAPLQRFLSEFTRGVRAVGNIRALAAVLSLSGLIWLSTFMFYDVAFDLFGHSGSLADGTVVAVIVALAVAAPSAPGFIGVYQLGCIVGFKLLGIDAELAMAYAIITHLFQYVLICGTGLLVLQIQGLSLGRLRADELTGR